MSDQAIVTGEASSSNPLAVVTGGNGFLGSHLCAVLAAQGWRVRSLSRRGAPSPCAPEARGQVEYVAVDIMDFDEFNSASEGADAIFHLAGRVSRDPEDSGALHALHVQGTKHFIRVVEQREIKQALYLSTSGVVAVSKDTKPLNEKAPYARDIISDWGYYLSKLYAEEEVMRACERGLPIKIARPSLLLGPGDPTGQSHEDLLLFLGDQLKAVPPGGINAVDVRDVAAFLPTLLERGEAGVGYLLGGDSLTTRAFINQIAQIVDRPAPLFDLPSKMTKKAMGPLKWISKTTLGGGIDPQTFEMACHYWYVDSALAESIGFKARPLSSTLLDALRDLEERGFY